MRDIPVIFVRNLLQENIYRVQKSSP
jgi:hypothetical protein